MIKTHYVIPRIGGGVTTVIPVLYRNPVFMHQLETSRSRDRPGMTDSTLFGIVAQSLGRESEYSRLSGYPLTTCGYDRNNIFNFEIGSNNE